VSKDAKNFFDFNFYTSDSLFSVTTLDRLQEIFVIMAPDWCRDARIWEDEEIVKTSIKVNLKTPGSLFEALQPSAKQSRQDRIASRPQIIKTLKSLGKPALPFDPENWSDSFVLTDRKQDLMLFYYYCTKPSIDILENRIGLHLVANEFEDISSTVWSQTFFELMLQQIKFDYCKLYEHDEFDSKNYNERNQVIGFNLQKSLPGLYWQNFFGPLLCDFIGREKLLSAPAYQVKEFPHGVLLTLGKEPTDWDTPEYREREQAVEAHLGKDFFFNKNDPDRQTRAAPFPKRT
jgi:hypothetical protein